MHFSNDDRKKISEAILAAEKYTSGEIVPVIVKQSDVYVAAHFRGALLLSYLLMILCYYLDALSHNPLSYLYTFIVGSIAGYMLPFFSFFKVLLTTKSEMNEEFRQKALESFVLNAVTETTNRNGVQLYISAMERKAMIIADIGIQKKLNNQEWESVIAELIPHLKQEKYADGICLAVVKIGKILAEHFPAIHDNEDELPNKLIIDL